MRTEHDRPTGPPGQALLAALEQQLHDRIAAATAARREPRMAPRGGAGPERSR